MILNKQDQSVIGSNYFISEAVLMHFVWFLGHKFAYCDFVLVSASHINKTGNKNGAFW